MSYATQGIRGCTLYKFGAIFILMANFIVYFGSQITLVMAVPQESYLVRKYEYK